MYEVGLFRGQSQPSGVKQKPFSPGPLPAARKVPVIWAGERQGTSISAGPPRQPSHEKSPQLKNLIGVIR
ncbi:hypothetical protein DVA81_19605, partial [Acinetobacter baumannii]